MKKIAILTLNGYFNHGNRLQNYALEKIVTNFNFHVTTLRIKIPTVERDKFSKRFLNLLRNPKKLPSIIIKKIQILIFKQCDQIQLRREMNFKSFSQKFLNESQSVINSRDELNQELNKYDYIIVGSDQVWNPNFLGFCDYYFANSDQKNHNIAYAPSFGVSKIPVEYINHYINGLNNFKYLSVREEMGQNLIKDLTGQQVPVLIDPTLLLRENDWFEILSKHQFKPSTKYLVTYFLSESTMRKNQKTIRQYANSNDLEIINLNDINDYERYTADPGQFLDYIKDASIVYTDSFHGSVFSIIFKKPFVVFNRGDMNSRIDTLLKKFKLEERHWNYIKNHKNDNQNSINYEKLESIIEIEYKKSIDFLKKSFGLCKEV